MGESKLKRLKREEMLLSCAGVQTAGGRVQVRWEADSAATPIFQQRINADRVRASQMVVDHCVGQWDQQAVDAIAAFDSGLFADTGTPFVGAGRCVARLTRGFAFPADWINIRAPAKQASEQSYLLGGGQPGGFLFSGRKGNWLSLLTAGAAQAFELSLPTVEYLLHRHQAPQLQAACR